MDPRYVTATEIAHLCRVPRGTVYYWASRDRWRRLPGRPVGYLRSDAQETWERRNSRVLDNTARSPR